MDWPSSGWEERCEKMAVSASDFSVYLGDVTLGRGNTLVLTRPSALYYFTFAYRFEGVSGAVSAATLAVQEETVTRVVYTWTPPAELARQIPQSVSGTGELVVTVGFDGSIDALDNPNMLTLRCPFTGYVADTVRPTASLTTEVVSDNATLQNWGLAVRGMSRLRYTVHAEGQEGATVENCRFTAGSAVCQGFSGTTAPLSAAGRLTPQAVVTDSRGRTATVESATVTVWEYRRPSVKDPMVLRCDANGVEDDAGAYLRVKAVCDGALLDGRNAVTLTARYRAVGASWSAAVTLQSGVEALLASSLDAALTYEVELRASDTLGNSAALTSASTGAAVTFHLREGGDGAAFGKRCDSAGLHCAWNAEFEKNVKVTGKLTAGNGTFSGTLTVGGKSILNIMYPVGSIFLSTISVSPATLIGGSWERIEDRFLLCCGSSYGAGTTGGAASVKLTTAQLPPHSHRVSGHAVPTELSHTHGVANVKSGATGEYGAYAESWGSGSGSRALQTDPVSQSHNHSIDITSASVGSGAAVETMPPYLAVYAWRRTA